MRAKEFINEEINPDILDPRFSHTQQIGDYTYTAALESDVYDPKQPVFVIKCYDDGKMIGRVEFYTTFGDSLVSALTNVHPDYQKQGIASTMYAYARMLGNTIEPSASQLPPGKKMWKAWKKSGDAIHLMKEDTSSTTLAELYGGDYPERDETFWDYVLPHEFDIPLDIQTLPKHKVMFMLLGQYRVEHIDEIMDMLDDDRKELVQHYVDDPALSSKVIVLAGDRIIDGNHRALAAAIKGVPINYVDLVDMEETDEIDEGLRVDVPNEDWLQNAIDYAKQKSPDRNGLPYMGKTTATVRQVEVPLILLKRIPGMRREQQNVRYDDLAAIEKIMRDTGKLPLHSHSNEEYKPFINVAYDGSAWVNEGNHRIMAAYRLGWDSLPVEISYFDGGERVESGPMYPGKIGLGESINEAEASDAALAARYGEFDPEDKPMLPRTQVGGAPAPTLWTAYQAIEDILGRGKVTDDEDMIEPGMYYVYQSNSAPKFVDTDGPGEGGSINLPNLESTSAKDIAVAVHEAYHAYVHSKSNGRVFSNEKIINKLAEKWLRKHLTGPELHVALEKIIGSRISYGPEHIPSGPLSDKR